SITSRPSRVEFKLLLGYVEINVQGAVGEAAFFRVPLQPWRHSGAEGLIVVDLLKCSVGVIDNCFTVGPHNLHAAKLVTSPSLPLCDEVAGQSAGSASVPLALPCLANLDGASSTLPDDPLKLVSHAVPVSLAESFAPLPLPVIQGIPSAPQTAAAPAVSGRRQSTRIACNEDPNYVSMVDKATNLKRRKLEGAGKKAAASVVPARAPRDKRGRPSDAANPLTIEDTLDLAAACALSFLPPIAQNHTFKPSLGASGGILSAWSDATLELLSSTTGPFFVHSSFSHLMMEASFSVTNVYGPCDHASKLCFLDSLRSLADSVHGPWIILGDFNLIRFPREKSNDSFNNTETDWFNDFINTLCFQDIPLLDRLYTWSNNQDHPTLCRLDCALVNLDWSNIFPDTTLSSNTRITSDHVPIVLNASTTVPKPSIFRFNNHWLNVPSFPPIVAQN
ncbi:hypothetical protein PVAP13_8NG205800, partial [Panicum virgatum]